MGAPLPVKVSRRGGGAWLPEVCLARGPAGIGVTGDGSYLALYGYAWVALLDPAQQKLRSFQLQVAGSPWPLGSDVGMDGMEWVEKSIPGLIHPIHEIRHLSYCFDQSAEHVVAYERAGEIWVRQWDPVSQQLIMRGPWPGCDPVLIQDSTVGFYPPDSDVLVFYLTPDRSGLRMRVQRDVYAVEHVMQDFPFPIILDQAVALPYLIELLGSEQANPDVTGFVVRSEPYPVYITDDLGTATFSAPGVANFYPVVVVHDLTGAGYTSPDDLGTATFSAPGVANFYPVVVVHDLTGAGYTSPDDLGTATFSAPSGGQYVLV